MIRKTGARLRKVLSKERSDSGAMDRELGILLLTDSRGDSPFTSDSSWVQLTNGKALSILLSPHVSLQVSVRLLATVVGWLRHERLPVKTFLRRIVTSRIRLYSSPLSCSEASVRDKAFIVESDIRLATRITPQERTWFVNGAALWGPGRKCIVAVLLRSQVGPDWRLPKVSEARVRPLTICSPDTEGGWSNQSISLGHFMQPRVQSVSGIEIWHSYLIVQDDKILLSEGRSDPRQDFVAGVSTLTLGSATPGTEPITRLIEPPLRWDTQDTGIFACGRVDTNWFHWIVDHLPQLLRAESEVDPNIPFLVRSNLPRQVYDALAFISHRDMIGVPIDRRVKVDSLLVPIFPGCVTDSPNIDMVSSVFDMKGLRALRQRFFDRESGRAHLGRRIFTARNSTHRRLENQEAVRAVLEGARLQRFSPAGSSFADQLSQYRNTDLLVAEGGADLAAMIMMKPGSHVVGLVSDAKGQAALWAQLADILEITFTPVVGVHNPRDPSVHASFVLTQDGLERLREIVRP